VVSMQALLSILPSMPSAAIDTWQMAAILGDTEVTRTSYGHLLWKCRDQVAFREKVVNGRSRRFWWRTDA